MTEYEVEISGTKCVRLEADSEMEAEEKANEMPLDLDDFSWTFEAEDVSDASLGVNE